MMSPERHKDILDELVSLAEDDDYEAAHAEADDLIMEFLPPDIREAYDKVGKWYG